MIESGTTIHLDGLNLAHVVLGGSPDGSGTPWFIGLVGAAGAYALLTALAGLSGCKQGRRWQLSAYIALLAGLLLAEAGALVLLFTDNAWRERLPGEGRESARGACRPAPCHPHPHPPTHPPPPLVSPTPPNHAARHPPPSVHADDPSGRWDQALAFVEANPQGVKLAFLSAMGAELAALLAAMWLHAIYQVGECGLAGGLAGVRVGRWVDGWSDLAGSASPPTAPPRPPRTPRCPASLLRPVCVRGMAG